MPLTDPRFALKFPPHWPIADRLLLSILADLEAYRAIEKPGDDDTESPFRAALDVARHTSFEVSAPE